MTRSAIMDFNNFGTMQQPAEHTINNVVQVLLDEKKDRFVVCIREIGDKTRLITGETDLES